MSPRARLVLVPAALVGVPIALGLCLPVEPWLVSLTGWFRAAGWFGASVYVAAFIVSALLFVPGVPAIMAAGFAYGPLFGFGIAFVAATLAAAATFGVSRLLGRPWAERHFGSHPHWQALDRVTYRYGFRLMLMLRLSPVVPFSLLNYMMGASRISFAAFILASTLGKAPSVLVYVYLASAVQRVSQLNTRPTSAAQELLYWLGLLVTVVAVWQLTRIAKQEARVLLRPSAQPQAGHE